uniref:CCHC-type domain-containing protein n=1 Tax=Lagenidium giganteum TaxID=4803 RepID=A0AAV2Z434_9STRA
MAMLVDTYFQARNVDHRNRELAPRILAILGTAQWYMIYRVDMSSVEEFFLELQKGFVPGDMQARLRDQLKGSHCKPTLNGSGLYPRTREEVQYRDHSTLAKAMKTALDYDRAHRNNRGSRFQGNQRVFSKPPRYSPPKQNNDEAEPMEIDSATISTEECRQKRLCFLCKKPGHVKANCPSAKSKQRSKKSVRFQGVKINTFETDDSESSSDEAIVFDKFTMNASEDQVHMVVNERDLVRTAGTVDDKHVTIMLDASATSNMIRPGLAEKGTAVRQTQIQRFDGTWTQPAPMKEVEAQDFRGRAERRKVGVCQEDRHFVVDEIHHVEFHISNVHMSAETKKQFQKGYTKDPEFKTAWKTKDGSERVMGCCT